MKTSRRTAPTLRGVYVRESSLHVYVSRHVAGDGTTPMLMSTHVRLLDASEADHEGPIDKLAFELVLATRLKAGDLVLCTAGDVVPADGVVVEGMATIEDGGETTSPIVTARRLLVRRGTHLASGYIVLRVAA